MLRLTCSIVLLAAANACIDAPTSAVFGVPAEPNSSEPGAIIGVVVSEQILLRDDGQEVALLGPQTRLLSGLVGAEIRIWGDLGKFEASGYWVDEFEVLAVDGLPAFDGKLWPAADGLAIYTRDGSVTALTEVPDDLAAHVGHRVWLITSNDGRCVRYGILEMDL